MTRQIFHKLLVFGLGCVSSVSFLTCMSSLPALSQSTNPTKAGSYSFSCENNLPTSTIANFDVGAEAGIMFFTKQIFVVFDSAIIEDYKPFIYPTSSTVALKAVVSVESPTIQFNANAGKFKQGGLVGQIGTIYYPEGSKVPKFQIVSITLKKANCPTAIADDSPPPGVYGVEDQPVTLPSGTVVQQESTVTRPEQAVLRVKMPDGIEFLQFFDEAGQAKGIQYIDPNGKKLAPGESITLPSGVTITQPPL